jgi:hypothetical protein
VALGQQLQQALQGIKDLKVISEPRVTEVTKVVSDQQGSKDHKETHLKVLKDLREVHQRV